ncbi:MAG: hypothetical protein IIC31_04135 [Chloroflexi bacterium]|nr:hypothetical protein [Chloroflexota bacterium]
MSTKFDPQLFFQEANNVALRVAGSELFSLLNRSCDLPSAWAAMVTSETGEDKVVAPGGIVQGGQDDTVAFVRATPIDVAFETETVQSRDGFSCKAEVRASVSVIPERSELRSFLNAVMGSRRVAQAKGLTAYLQPAVRSALGQCVSRFDAASLVNARACDDVADAVAESLKAACFSAGLTQVRPPTVRFESTGLRQVQKERESAAARKVKHDSAHELQRALGRAREEHLDDLASTLGRLSELATASPDVGLPELLRTFTESQRGELYEALFAADTPASTTRWIVVAAGDELLFFDPHAGEAPARRVKVGGVAGPVRSIQVITNAQGGAELLLGAATGVYLWHVDGEAASETYFVEHAPAVRGGFNSVTIAGDRLFASHSELGLCEWKLSDPSSMTVRFERLTLNARAVRGVQALDGVVYCSIDDQVIRFAAGDPTDVPQQVHTGSDGTITALCATPEALFAGNSHGELLRWSGGSENAPEVLHRGMKRPVESVQMLASHGVRRLVFADTALYVYARVVGDSFTCHYEAGGQTLRRVEVAPDLIVATNDLRDRLICWSPGKPKQPHATINVSGMIGRSIQDVCLVPQA